MTLMALFVCLFVYFFCILFTQSGMTAAHDAAALGQLQCLQYLLENTHCSAKDRTLEGATVLHIACKFGRVEVVRWLVEEGGCSPGEKGGNDVTPVHLCAARGKWHWMIRLGVGSFKCRAGVLKLITLYCHSVTYGYISSFYSALFLIQRTSHSALSPPQTSWHV